MASATEPHDRQVLGRGTGRAIWEGLPRHAHGPGGARAQSSRCTTRCRCGTPAGLRRELWGQHHPPSQFSPALPGRRWALVLPTVKAAPPHPWAARAACGHAACGGVHVTEEVPSALDRGLPAAGLSHGAVLMPSSVFPCRGEQWLLQVGAQLRSLCDPPGVSQLLSTCLSWAPLLAALFSPFSRKTCWCLP